MFEQRPGAVIRHGSEVRLAGGRRLGTGQAGGVSELEGRELAQDGSFSVWSDGGRSHHTRRRPPPPVAWGRSFMMIGQLDVTGRRRTK